MWLSLHLFKYYINAKRQPKLPVSHLHSQSKCPSGGLFVKLDVMKSNGFIMTFSLYLGGKCTSVRPAKSGKLLGFFSHVPSQTWLNAGWQFT